MHRLLWSLSQTRKTWVFKCMNQLKVFVKRVRSAGRRRNEFQVVQFSSVVQLCPNLHDPMNQSTPGLPVHHQFPEFTQIQIHWVSDAIQPSHPLSPPSPFVYNLFQHQFSSVQLLSRVQLFVTSWTTACPASLSITNSRSLLKLISIESVMPSNHLIRCRPLLLPPSIFPSIRVFSNESVLLIRWPKYWNFSISPSNEYSGQISFRMDWLDLLAVQGSQESSPAPQFKSINSSALNLYGSTITSTHDY